MIRITGEVRKVLDQPYADRKTGEMIDQAVVVLEPLNSRQNYEVHLSAKQIKAGARKVWESLKGQHVSVAVSLYINWDYRFFKYIATGNGEPVKE